MRRLEIARLWQNGDSRTWDTAFYIFDSYPGDPIPTQAEIEKSVHAKLSDLGVADFVGACLYSIPLPEDDEKE